MLERDAAKPARALAHAPMSGKTARVAKVHELGEDEEQIKAAEAATRVGQRRSFEAKEPVSRLREGAGQLDAAAKQARGELSVAHAALVLAALAGLALSLLLSG